MKMIHCDQCGRWRATLMLSVQSDLGEASDLCSYACLTSWSTKRDMVKNWAAWFERNADRGLTPSA